MNNHAVLPSIFDKLIEPSADLQDVALRHKSRLLAIFLLVATAVFIIVDITLLTSIPDYGPPVLGYLFLLLSFIINRTRHYKVAASLILAMFPIVVFYRIVSGEASTTSAMLSYLILCFILSSILLSRRGTAILSLVCVVATFLLPVIPSNHSLELNELVSATAVNIIGAVLLLVGMYHRDWIEGDRQAVLRQSEEMLRLALEAAQMGIWRWDVSTNAVIWSEQVESIFGLESGEFGGSYMDYLALIHPEERTTVEQTIMAALEGKTPDYYIEHRLIWPDGSVHWLEARGRVYRDEAGRPLRMSGTVIDATMRKTAEVQEAQRKEWLQKVLELGKQVTQRVTDWRACLLSIREAVQVGLAFDRVGVFLYDAETQMVRGAFGTTRSGELQETGEYEQHVAEDKVFADLLANPDGFLFISNLDEVMQRSPDHEMYGVGEHATVAAWAGEKPVAVLAVDNAISQRPMQEAQLEALRLFAGYAGLAIENARLLKQLGESEARFRTLAENVPGVIYLCQNDARWSMMYLNDAVEELTGYSKEAFYADEISFVDLYHPDDAQEIFAEVDEALVAQRPFALTYRLRKSPDEWYWIEETGVGIYDENGELQLLEGFLHDVTERKQVEAEREALITELEAKNAELERFTYTVSHDLKSPLVTVKGFLGYLEKDIQKGDTTRVQNDILRIREATDKMQELLEDLLELSRIGRLVNEPQYVSMNEVVDEAMKLVMGRITAHNVQMNIRPDMPKVYGDQPRLVELVQNLLDNAVKFSSGVAQPFVEIGAKVLEGETVFFVRDNGIGIAPKYFEKVFSLFDRLDQNVEGTGIGLTLVKRIVEVHNGRIWIESEPGQGATFFFTLALAE